MVKKFAFLMMALSTITAPAYAEQRDLCADRPGIGTPPCTVAPGHVMIELGLGDWTHDVSAGVQSDMVQTGQVTARIGIDEHTEFQMGWGGYAWNRNKDLTSGLVDKVRGGGDLSVGILRNLQNPDGSGTSIALGGFVSLPIGKSGIGAGNWSASILIPMSLTLSNQIGLSLTPEIDAAPNASGDGQHLAYGNTVGLSFSLPEQISLTPEIAWAHDDDPTGKSSSFLAGLSLAYLASPDWQLDVGANIGLNANAPAQEMYFGVARRF